jgi:hypothetical protein
MSMALFYVKDTAIAEQPEGFVPHDGSEPLFASASGWEQRILGFESILSGFHE